MAEATARDNEVDYTTEGLSLSNAFAMGSPKTVTFYDSTNELIGTLYLENPMRFEGNAEESAKVFFNFVTEYLKERK